MSIFVFLLTDITIGSMWHHIHVQWLDELLAGHLQETWEQG